MPAPTRATARRIAALAALALHASPPSARAAVCRPTLQWEWRGALEAPSFPGACSQPLVARLADTNGDGAVDLRDVPSVVFHHCGPGGCVLSALDGDTGRPRWTVTDPRVRPAEPALADLDGDGASEVVALDANMTELVAFRGDGSFWWRSEPLAPPPPFTLRGSPLGVADLDQDGSPEVYLEAVVLDPRGRIRWDRGGFAFPWSVSNAADLVPSSPGLELVVGGTVRAADGALLWSFAPPGPFGALGDFDGDGAAELVLASDVVQLVDAGGSALGAPHAPGLGAVSQPAVADLDGDGDPEVVVSVQSELQALDWTGAGWSVKWSLPIVDVTGLTAPSAADLDGDGAAEVLYRDEERWYVVDGRTGGEHSRLDFVSRTGLEAPVVADVDGDCVTEILVSSCEDSSAGPGSVRAYECAGAPTARSVWNQYAYHATNVGEDGRVPAREPAPWRLRGAGWLAQPVASDLGAPVADAGPDLEVCAGASALLDASASVSCGLPGLLHRWLDAAGGVVCDWSVSPRCAVAPAATTAYTLEVACPGTPGCAASDEDQVLVTVRADVLPPGLGNTLLAVRAGGDVVLAWAAEPLAASYLLYRGVVKEAWPPAPFLAGLAAPAATLPDVPAPPALFFYRVAGASCSGREGP